MILRRLIVNEKWVATLTNDESVIIDDGKNEVRMPVEIARGLMQAIDQWLTYSRLVCHESKPPGEPTWERVFS